MSIDLLNYSVKYSSYHESRINQSLNLIEYYSETTDVYCLGSKNYNYRVILSSYNKNIVPVSSEVNYEEKNAIYLSDNSKDIENCKFVICLDENEYAGFNDPEFLYDIERLIEIK